MIYKLVNKSVTDLLAEYRTSRATLFQNTYNIVLNSDGTVFDKNKKVCYSTLQAWASNTLQQKGKL